MDEKLKKTSFSALNISKQWAYLFAASMLTLAPLSASASESNNLNASKSLVVQQDKKTVSGTVVDANGEPIIGATVKEVGTQNATITDVNGTFKLNVKPGAMLTVSSVGFKEQTVKASDKVDVTLKEDAEVLEQVVVVGYGTAKRKDVSGAITSVKFDDGKLTNLPNPNALSALSSQVAGLHYSPTSSAAGDNSSTMTLRGKNVIPENPSAAKQANNAPLLIVDGVISYGGISEINTNDIATIDVLKDASAAAIYGSRAANGVIIITTKSGKGLEKGKPQVSFSSNVSFDVVGRLPEFQKTYAQGSGGRYSPTSGLSWGPKISELSNDPNYGGNTDNEFTQKYGMQSGKYYVPQRASAGLDPWATPQAYDNTKEFFETGITWSNSLNVAQTLEKSSYSVSLGNTHQDGIIPKTGMDRYNVKVSAETKLTNNFTTGFAGNYITTSIDKAVTSGNGLLRTVYASPASYDLAGIPSHVDGDIYKQNSFRGNFDNAYWAIDNNKYTEDTNRFFGNVYATYQTDFGTANHKLNAKYMLGVDAYTTHYSDSYGYGSNTGGGRGQIENYGWTNATYNSLLTINYDWRINDDWGLNAVAGNEFIQSNRKKYYEYGTNYNFAGWNHINNATTQLTEEERWKNRTVGFFGNVSASYRNMLYLTVTGRQDYVSNMPRNNRSFFYPSVSAGFILTELDELKNDVVNYAKLRVSYAEVGQAGDFLENYYSTPTYGGGFYSLTPIMYPIKGTTAYTPYYTIFDPNLKPQNTRSYEIGADVNFFDNLITLNYTYSRQNVKDQIFSVPLASSTGASKLLTNGGKIHTDTHEITLGFNPIRTKNINWDFGFNWTKIDNYVDELAPGVENISLGGYVTPQVRASAGEKFPVIYGVGYKRDANGNRLVDENGLPVAGEAQVIGKVSPDFVMGFNTSLRLWKCTISAVLDWKQGGQMYSRTTGLADYYGVSKRTENREGTIIFDGYKTDGTKNDIAITGANAQQVFYSRLNDIDESSVYDNSFIKLREVAVSYKVLQKKWMELSVNAFARNILVWAQMPDLDPEASQGNNNMSGAFEDYSMPQTASFGFGFNIKF